MYRLVNIEPTPPAAPRDAADVTQLRASLQADNFSHLEIALYKHFMKVRGRDPATTARPGTIYPATTNLDVMQLAAMWTREVLKASVDDATDRVRHKEWLDTVAEVHVHADVEHKPDAIYPKNTDFWQSMSKTAIWLDVRKLRPEKWDLWWDSVGEAVEALPGTLAGVARSAGSAGSSAVGAAGDAAKTIGRGFSDFFSEPVRVIAVLIGGAILLPPVIRAMRD